MKPETRKKLRKIVACREQHKNQKLPLDPVLQEALKPKDNKAT
jgi:hypothetical protein